MILCPDCGHVEKMHGPKGCNYSEYGMPDYLCQIPGKILEQEAKKK